MLLQEEERMRARMKAMQEAAAMEQRRRQILQQNPQLLLQHQNQMAHVYRQQIFQHPFRQVVRGPPRQPNPYRNALSSYSYTRPQRVQVSRSPFPGNPSSHPLR
ncbi:unnamed protein product [Darwinula stevensoni]|uniref:Uncharacterized protein n=1 Tax=Darwinula stevensoni TaxID=69355 RepID=A0A7R9AC28_9CRUS|nr:unnamed protein product [Darwinula stevensoni]CAG0899480.1 unnamed protein product [Darwinula stevensoni]